MGKSKSPKKANDAKLNIVAGTETPPAKPRSGLALARRRNVEGDSLMRERALKPDLKIEPASPGSPSDSQQLCLPSGSATAKGEFGRRPSTGVLAIKTGAVHALHASQAPRASQAAQTP